MKVVKIGKNLCTIGSNAKENWQILGESQPENLLFHLSSFPSCFVIVDCKEKISENLLIEFAQLCKHNTKYRNLKNIYVDYTRCANVIKTEIMGEIEYKQRRKVLRVKI